MIVLASTLIASNFWNVFECWGLALLFPASYSGGVLTSPKAIVVRNREVKVPALSQKSATRTGHPPQLNTKSEGRASPQATQT